MNLSCWRGPLHIWTETHLDRGDGSAADLCKSDNLSVRSNHKQLQLKIPRRCRLFICLQLQAPPPLRCHSLPRRSHLNLCMTSSVSSPPAHTEQMMWARCGDGWILMCKHRLILKVPAEEVNVQQYKGRRPIYSVQHLVSLKQFTISGIYKCLIKQVKGTVCSSLSLVLSCSTQTHHMWLSAPGSLVPSEELKTFRTPGLHRDVFFY